jgi:hypothetical protein
MASVTLEGFILRAKTAWAAFTLQRADAKMFHEAANEWERTWASRIDAIDKKYTGVWDDLNEQGKKNLQETEDIWKDDGVTRWKKNMDDRRKVLQDVADAEKFIVDIQKKNRHEYNDALEKTIKLTQSMAQQFATASKLEQEQTKFLIEKLNQLEPKDIGSLTESEKKLIGKQGILKKIFEGMFKGFAEKELGTDHVVRMPKAIKDKMQADRDTSITTGIDQEKQALIDMTKRYKEVREGLPADKRKEVDTAYQERRQEFIETITGLEDSLTTKIDKTIKEIIESDERKKKENVEVQPEGPGKMELRISLSSEAKRLLEIMDDKGNAMNNRDYERATG